VIVLDANIAAKWYLPERGSDAAVELMSGPKRLFAPELIRLEVLSAITRRVRKGEATAAESKEQCQRWLNYLGERGITLVPEAELLLEAVELSLKTKHVLFDCMYLAAAKVLDAPLLTADRPFFDRVRPFYKQITLLPGCEGN
jgi:predicted nucleic acid-binding protein